MIFQSLSLGFPMIFPISPMIFFWASHMFFYDVPMMFPWCSSHFPIFPIPSCNQTSQWKILKMKLFIGTSSISMVHFPAIFDDTRGYKSHETTIFLVFSHGFAMKNGGFSMFSQRHKGPNITGLGSNAIHRAATHGLARHHRRALFGTGGGVLGSHSVPCILQLCM